ncbi:hypothetical protein GLV89_11735 [Halomonas alkaliantarctica]|nr:hypothetical protein [Halomonas alkaliantarctica]
MHNALHPFKALIKQHCGLLLEGIAEDRLHKALQTAARVENKRLEDLLPMLQQNEELIKDLVSQLTVNETYFFRENAQLELLTQHLLPRWLRLKGHHPPVNILSAGCSSGEEPYSLVIALEEAWGKQAADLFKVAGGDLDRQILRKAREGLYSPFSFRGVPEPLRLRYFESAGPHFQLKPPLRHRVTFHELNLLAAHCPAERQEYDVILFRNVSIYFDTDTRLKIQRKLAEMLKPDGFLIVGSSETLANDLGVFTLVEEQGHYYFVKGQALLPPSYTAPRPLGITSGTAGKRAATKPPRATRARSAAPPPSPPPRGEKKTAPVPTPSAHIDDIVQRLLNQESHLASQQLDQLLAAGHHVREARLLKAWLLGNRKKFADALALVEAQLRVEPWWLDALVLQGLLHKWQSQFDEAEKAFKKAVYIRPDCWPAHYYLAQVCRHGHKSALASRAYKAAQRCLQGQEGAPTGLEVLPLNLNRSDVVFLIEHQLARLAHTPTPGVQDRE